MTDFDKKSSVLTSKLVGLYGKSAEARAFIEAEVPKWLSSRNGKKMTASDIQSFQLKIENAVKKIEEKAAARESGPTHHDVVLPKERIAEESKSQAATYSEGVPLSYLLFAVASPL